MKGVGDRSITNYKQDRTWSEEIVKYGKFACLITSCSRCTLNPLWTSRCCVANRSWVYLISMKMRVQFAIGGVCFTFLAKEVGPYPPTPHAGSFCMCSESYRNHSLKVTWITSNQFLRLSMQRFVRIKSLFSDMAFRKTPFDRIQSSRHFANCRETRALQMLYKLSRRTMAVFAVCVRVLNLPCKWCLKSGRDVLLEYQDMDILN